MADYRISIVEEPSKADIDTLIRSLISYNNAQAEKENWQHLAIFIRDDQGELVGGLYGYTHWGWLFISHLWVAASLRSQGYGTKLVTQAEQEAAWRGCRHSYLDTYDFQALNFYRKLGYEIFGFLDDFPKNLTRYYLYKRALSS